MKRGEIWLAAAPGGDRPVLVLTRDPVADRIGAVTVAAVTGTKRDLVSALELTAPLDRVPSDCNTELRQHPGRRCHLPHRSVDASGRGRVELALFVRAERQL